MLWISFSEQPLQSGKSIMYFITFSSNVVCFLKIVTQLISHCPEAAARDFPTGTSLLLSEGVGPVDMLSLGASTSCPLSLIPI